MSRTKGSRVPAPRGARPEDGDAGAAGRKGPPPAPGKQEPAPHRPRRQGTAALSAPLLVPGIALAEQPVLDDEAAQRQAAADVWSGLFLLAALAFAVHLMLKGKGPQSLREAVKGLAFLASAYLAGFFFLGSVSGIARFLLFFGMERDVSVALAVPLGMVVAYRIYTAYEKWRVPK